jgi:DNA polymerase III sliding clamp (beta) subunit (PCNA family)
MDATFDKVSIDASFIKDNGIPVSIEDGTATFENGMKAGATPTDSDFNIPKEGELLITSGALSAFDTLKTFLGKDELRPVMTGAYFANGKICATDAHRLRVLEAQFESEGVILSKVALELLKHSQIKGHTDYATFEDIGVTLGREWLVDAIYPKYEAIMPNPDSAESTLTFSKKALLPLLENALKAAHKDTKLVVLTCEGEGLNVSASDLDRGTNFAATAPASGSIKIGYNAAQLIDVLKSIEADEVTIHYFGESRASLFNLTSLLMPVMINND